MRTKDNINFDPHPTDIDRVRVTIECVECRRDHSFDMPEADFFKGMEQRRNGGLIQQCFPNLAPEHREMFVSRICPSCFDAISHD
jgi:hypothetical protein